jgi:hypothetical protein
MSDPAERINEAQLEFDGLNKIKVTPEWNAYIAVLKRHKLFCREKALSAIRSGKEAIEAVKWVAQADNTDKLVGLLHDRITELENQLRGGNA